MPSGKRKPYAYSFQIALFLENEGIDTSLLVLPIAKITYHPKLQKFECDEDYTNKTNADIIKLYKEYMDAKQGKKE